METLERLESEELYVARGSWGEAKLRPPQEPEFRRFVATSARDGADLYAAQKALVMDCLVEPDRKTFSQIVAKRPGLVVKIAADLIALAQDEEARFLERVG
jgi:hypothetical protein